MKNKSIFFTALVWVYCFSCKKKVETIYITDPELRKAANICEGSYFIYRDSVVGTLDSYSVSYSETYFSETSYDRTDEVMNYWLAKDGHKGIFSIFTFYGSLRGSFMIYNNTDEPVRLNMLQHPFRKTDSLYNLYNSVHTAYYDSIYINKIKHVNVYESYSLFILEKDTTEQIRTFYSPDEGLVKFSYTSNDSVYKVYELERSEIRRK